MGFPDLSSGNQLLIASMQLTMIPEPSSLALCTVPVLTGLAFLRKRRSHLAHSLRYRPLC